MDNLRKISESELKLELDSESGKSYASKTSVRILFFSCNISVMENVLFLILSIREVKFNLEKYC